MLPPSALFMVDAFPLSTVSFFPNCKMPNNQAYCYSLSTTIKSFFYNCITNIQQCLLPKLSHDDTLAYCFSTSMTVKSFMLSYNGKYQVFLLVKFPDNKYSSLSL